MQPISEGMSGAMGANPVWIALALVIALGLLVLYLVLVGRAVIQMLRHDVSPVLLTFAFLALIPLPPVLVLGIFSKRVGTVPAVCGMLSGLVFTAAYIVGSVYAGMPNWCFGIGPQGIGVVGMLLNFSLTLALTPWFPAPSDEVQVMIESIHEPEGAGPSLGL